MQKERMTRSNGNSNHTSPKTGLLDSFKQEASANGSLYTSGEFPPRVSLEQTQHGLNEKLSIAYSSIEHVLADEKGITIQLRSGSIRMTGICLDPIYDALNSERVSRIVEIKCDEWVGEEHATPTILRMDWYLTDE